MAEQGVVVVSGGPEGFKRDVTAGRHHLVADEPIDVGGTDRGPGPYELILAALGACMSMTIALYARRKAIPLRDVVVRLSHGRNYELTGDLTAEQRAKLVEIAHKCPVHRTLSDGIDIRISA